MEKVESIMFTKPVQKLELEPEQIIIENTEKPIDTLYLKSPFSTKSSPFEYSGKTSSEPINVTNVPLSTTAASTYGIKSDEATFKIDVNEDVSRKTGNKPKNTSESVKERALILKIPETRTLESTPGKMHTSAENSDNPNINMSKSQNPKHETPVTSSPKGNIDTLFMKFPFTVKSSAFGYLNKMGTKTEAVAEKTLPSTDILFMKFPFIVKSSAFGYLNKIKTEAVTVTENTLLSTNHNISNAKSFVTTIEDVTKKNNKGAENSDIRGSDNHLTVVKAPRKPTGVLVVKLAHTATSKSPFICKLLTMERPITSPRRELVRIQDQGVYAANAYYVSNVIAEVPGPLCKLKDRVKDTESFKICSKTKLKSDSEKKKKSQKVSNPFGNLSSKQKMGLIIMAMLITLAAVISFMILKGNSDSGLEKYSELGIASRRYNLLDKKEKEMILINMNMNPSNTWFSWECKNGLCQKINQPHMAGPYKSHSRCTLLCTDPQLWPLPTGHKFFGNEIVALAVNGIKYSHKTVPSQDVQKYLNEAFTLFKIDMMRLEVTDPKEKEPLDLPVKDLHIEFDVESDADPRLRLDTEESYSLTIETTDVINVKINSPSFCGVRHGLDTLSQFILLDQRTGYLITLIHANIEDAPSYKYRGLMIDTARNYIPMNDLSRTIDAMAMCKLNTFHWKISDAASFPMVIPDYPQLFEYGAYDREMVYTAEDIKFLVERAGFRGIRILIEVAAPGPVGRAWSWTTDAYRPVAKGKTGSASDVLCLRLKMHESAFDVLEAIYTLIIELTQVNDVFHLSNGLFSFVNCFGLIEDRDIFLDRALYRLRIANNGTLPRLPLIWYNANLMSRSGWTWYNFGIQIHDKDLPETILNKYKLIQSSRWDLSCEMKKHRCVGYRTWQQMYNWRTWRDLDVLTIEGGEAVLWTDLVDGNNLDSHLWPRTAAVSERLWSDAVANKSTSPYEYLRLDAQRWRMLIRGVKAQTVWPTWCSFNPGQCFNKIKT